VIGKKKGQHLQEHQREQTLGEVQIQKHNALREEQPGLQEQNHEQEDQSLEEGYHQPISDAIFYHPLLAQQSQQRLQGSEQHVAIALGHRV